jgi:single-strand DNA-binding protein
MARNQFTWISGKLTKDAKTQTFTNSIKCSFSVAVERDKRPDEERAKADFIPVVTWKRLADKCQNLRKGDTVSVIGTIRTGSYEKNGKTVYTTELWADKIFFDESTKPAVNRSTDSDNIFGDEEGGFEPMDEDSDLPFG